MAEATGSDEHDRATLTASRPEDGSDEPGAGEQSAAAPPAAGDRAARRRDRFAIGITLLPLVVAALVVAVQTHGSYIPTGDHALIELQARDVGRHPVLYGLYSRADWAHPGPAFAYLSAPFYRLLGEAPISLDLVALLVNGGAVAGMALIARRLAGTPAMLATLLAVAFLVRTLGAEFLRDPWNPYVTVLPYGLMIYLTWAMLCRRLWALPLGVVVATFLSQTHVGFVLLALPLLALGTAGLVLGVRREANGGAAAAGGDGDADADAGGDDPDSGPTAGGDRRRRLATALLGSGALAALLWLPPVIDAFGSGRSNLANIVRFFREGGDDAHTLLQGWGAVTGQFALPPEWLVDSNGQSWSGEDVHMYSRPVPWLLGLVALAAVVLWRRRGEAGRGLVVVLTTTLVLGIVAVARTVGGAYYYRLRWLWIAPAVAFALVVWALWVVVTRRWGERGGRVLTGLALAVLVVLSGVNSYTAVATDTVMDADGDVVAALLPGVLDEIEGKGGVVVVNDTFGTGAWYSRGIVLQLVRMGYDVRVTADQRHVFGDRWVYDGGPVAAELVVVRDEFVPEIDSKPEMRLVSTWTSVTDEELARAEEAQAELDADYEAGRVYEVDYHLSSPRRELYDNDLATYYEVRVYANDSNTALGQG